MGRTLVDVVDRPDVASLRLKDVLIYHTKQAISFYVGLKILSNESICDVCGSGMLTEKRSERVDGIQWRCLRKKKLCSRKSIRTGTFFARSQLPLATWLVIFYMWANDYSNKQIVKETGLRAASICDWLNFCREVCQNYCHNQRMLGGADRHVEIDEARICKRNYKRRRTRVGASQWVFGGVERGDGGLAFAFRVKYRTKKTLLSMIRKHILPGTTIISDEWPAYKKLSKRLGRYVGYKHYTICHKRRFARTVVENGIPLRVHTNKCEGQWMHMKHKIKRFLGTSNANTASYVEEAVFRQNCRASGWDILSKFLKQIYLIYNAQ